MEEKYGDRPAFAEPDEEGRIAYEHKYAKLENGDLLGITWNLRERIIIVQRVKKGTDEYERLMLLYRKIFEDDHAADICEL